MAQTVIGIFRNSTEAQNAKEHLLKNGFSDKKIDIARRSETNLSDDITESQHTGDFGDKVSRFFSSLFGNEAESEKYARAAAGGTVITVHAQDADEAEVAADILDDYGAIDVDEYASGYSEAPTDTIKSAEYDQLGGMNSGRAGITDRIAPDLDDTTTTPGNTKPNRLTGSQAEREAEWTGKNREADRFSTEPASAADMTGSSTEARPPGDRADRETPIVAGNQNPGKKETQTSGRVHSRIFERPVEETNRLQETERTTADRPAPDTFRDVEEKQETVREILRDTESETDDLKARREADDMSRKPGEEHDKWDDVHRQRPGII